MKRSHPKFLTLGAASLLLAGPLLYAQDQIPPPEPVPGVPLPEETFPGAPPLPPELPPEPVPSHQIPVETGVPANAGQSASQAEADLEYLRQFSLTNAQTRTGFHAAGANADRFFQGFAGVPHPSFSDLLPLGRPSVFEMRVGPVKVRPQVATGVTVSDISGTDHRWETEFNETVTLALEIGDPLSGRFISANYGVSELFGVHRKRTNDIDQSLEVLAQYDFEKLRLGASVNYTSLAGDDREFTNGTEHQVLTAAFTATYQWTEKSSFDLDITVPVEEFSGGLGSGGVTATVFANYSFTPKTLFGVGFAAGYLTVQDSDSQVFEQALVRLLSTVNPFFLYYVTAGVDFRDFGGGNHVTHPVFALGGTWTPREGTSLSLAAEQRVQNSASVIDADFLSTSVTLTLAQRIGSSASASVAFGYEHADYEGTRPGLDVSRVDDTFFGQLAVSAEISRHCTLMGTLTYRDTESTSDGQAVRQAGLQIIYNF